MNLSPHSALVHYYLRKIKYFSAFLDYRIGYLVTDASPSINVFAQNPFLALSTKIVNVYSEAIRQNMEYLSISSARIIQEQTIKAWTNAAQSCSAALAENAMFSQQQAVERLVDANRKVFEILAGDLSAFRMQPVTGFSNWLPAIPASLPSAKVKSGRVK